MLKPSRRLIFTSMLLGIFEVYDSIYISSYPLFLLVVIIVSSWICWSLSTVVSYFVALFLFSDKSCLRNGDLKWYFFCPREKKYASGSRMKRTTEFGFWKTTGNDRSVHYEGEVVGKIKTLIFHRGQASKGERTNWVMHEYRLEEKGLADRGVVQVTF